MQVYFEGYGCSQNLGETHALERSVLASGHRTVPDPSQAHVAVLVTCGVIESTERRMVRRWRALLQRAPRVVVTGCLVPLRSSLFSGPGRERTTFLPIREQQRLPELLDAPSPPTDSESPLPMAGSAPEGLAATAEVVIAQGCTSRCTYCFSRLARGPLSSVPLDELVRRVGEAVSRGAVEVRLSSLDTSCWGRDFARGERLPDLLRAVAQIPGEFRVRVGMMSPQTLAPIAEEVLAALSGPHFFRFLHLPVQSGSDSVLRAMGRGYTAEEFRQQVHRARTRLPDLTLATDVIVGFPTETDEDFAATLRLIDEVAPEIVNVTRYSARPMTPAARLHSGPSSATKRRSRRLTELRMRVARARMEQWIGRREQGLVTEPGREQSSLVRLGNYLPVVVSTKERVGTRVEVSIDGARSTYLLGRTGDGAKSGPKPVAAPV